MPTAPDASPSLPLSSFGGPYPAPTVYPVCTFLSFSFQHCGRVPYLIILWFFESTFFCHDTARFPVVSPCVPRCFKFEPYSPPRLFPLATLCDFFPARLVAYFSLLSRVFFLCPERVRLFSLHDKHPMICRKWELLTGFPFIIFLHPIPASQVSVSRRLLRPFILDVFEPFAAQLEEELIPQERCTLLSLGHRSSSFSVLRV